MIDINGVAKVHLNAEPLGWLRRREMNRYSVGTLIGDVTPIDARRAAVATNRANRCQRDTCASFVAISRQPFQPQ
jgi:hypothetical protein